MAGTSPNFRIRSPSPFNMITRFLTDVRVKFNPFSPRAKPARLFLSLIPPNARADGMKVETKMLPRTSTEPATLDVKFKDGKELSLQLDKMRIPEVMEQVDRHSRVLARKEELTGN
ncbi:39S ribosomal protein L44, mitochondrial [Paraconiothyrium brasiliense]|uniref:Large ribosomal subunit protein mL53 n=1 Tax=Paraconiothyrium brasiliense TaxID=300254 RepID=A0ABR3RH41_9PLEO